jgi:hypothetical protein
MYRTAGAIKKGLFLGSGKVKKQMMPGSVRMQTASPGSSRAPVTVEPFMDGSSTVYIEKMYESWFQGN